MTMRTGRVHDMTARRTGWHVGRWAGQGGKDAKAKRLARTGWQVGQSGQTGQGCRQDRMANRTGLPAETDTKYDGTVDMTAKQHGNQDSTVCRIGCSVHLLA